MGKRKPAQGELAFRTHGGKRKGAGRPAGPRPRVWHRRREKLDRNCPVHVTLRFRVKVTRTEAVWEALCAVVAALHEARPDVRVTELSLQDGHVHAIVEGDSTASVRFGLHSLSVRLGKAINRALGRTGRVFDDRHHRHVLRTPAEVRFAKSYVLLNRRRHLAKENRPLEPGIDPFSSGTWFQGWIPSSNIVPATPSITRPPRSWLGAIGWKRRGLLSPSEIPGVARRRRSSSALPDGSGPDGDPETRKDPRKRWGFE